VAGVKGQEVSTYIRDKGNPRTPTTFTPFQLAEFARGIVADCARLIEEKHGEACAQTLWHLLESDVTLPRNLCISNASAPSL
jgi:hypothetical protein